ncbi:hypothetical protein IT575_15135 [bacterium]|nr:hypothetical protein [bacterium]
MQHCLALVLFALVFLRACGAGAEPQPGTAGGADAGGSAPLLPAGDEWGLPPQEDWPQDIVNPLSYAGWYRHLGADSFVDLLAIGPDRVLLSGEKSVRAYSLKDGALLWSYPIDSVFFPDSAVANNDYLRLQSTYDSLTLSMRDGTLASSAPADISTGEGWQSADLRPMYLREEEAAPDALKQAAAAAGLEQGLEAQSELRDERYMAVLYQSYPAQHEHWGVNAHLLVFDLDAGGGLKAGSTRMLEQPELPREPVERFMKAASPHADSALMQELVSGGVGSCQALLQQLPQMNSAQLDSLMALCVYISSHQMQEYSAYPPVELLYTRLEELHDPQHAKKLMEWIGNEQLQPARGRCLGLLANLGNTEAGDFLMKYYDGLAIQKLDPRKPPYRLQPASPYGGDAWQADSIPPTPPAQAALAQGGTATAFVADGLASERAIYIGLDQDSDSAFEQILATGCSDVYFMHTHPGGVARDAKGAALGLSVSGDSFTLSYNKARIETRSYGEGPARQSYRLVSGGDPLSSRLELTQLRLDSDSDGLTDLLEAQLMLDPQQKDSDGDGLSDAEDACPNVNPASMGKLERGVARALAFFFQTDPQGEAWWRMHVQNLPWSARYISVSGMGPVSYGGVAGAFGICLKDEPALSAYQDLLQGYNPFTLLEIGYQESLPQMANAEGLNALSGPPAALPSHMYEAPEGGAQPDGSEAAAEAAAGAAGSPESAGTAPQPSEGLPGDRSVLWFNLSLNGFMIQMVEIDGELYPVRQDMTWIS